MKNSPVQRREPASGAFSKSLAVRRLGGGGAANVGGLCRHWLSGLDRASLRKFCAVTASTHSSLAPHGPRSRKRASRNTRLRGARTASRPSSVADRSLHMQASQRAPAQSRGNLHPDRAESSAPRHSGSTHCAAGSDRAMNFGVIERCKMFARAARAAVPIQCPVA